MAHCDQPERGNNIPSLWLVNCFEKEKSCAGVIPTKWPISPGKHVHIRGIHVINASPPWTTRVATLDIFTHVDHIAFTSQLVDYQTFWSHLNQNSDALLFQSKFSQAARMGWSMVCWNVWPRASRKNSSTGLLAQQNDLRAPETQKQSSKTKSHPTNMEKYP
jgi:hypothetical protein